MLVRDYMNEADCVARPKDKITHARALLEQRRINQLPVVVNGRVVGILTDRDLRDAFPSVFDAPGFTGEGPKIAARMPDDIRVEEVMTQKVLTIAPDDRLTDAAKLMRKERLGSVPVVDKGRLVGILTRSDILKAFVDVYEAGDSGGLGQTG